MACASTLSRSERRGEASVARYLKPMARLTGPKTSTEAPMRMSPTVSLTELSAFPGRGLSCESLGPRRLARHRSLPRYRCTRCQFRHGRQPATAGTSNRQGVSLLSTTTPPRALPTNTQQKQSCRAHPAGNWIGGRLPEGLLPRDWSVATALSRCCLGARKPCTWDAAFPPLAPWVPQIRACLTALRQHQHQHQHQQHPG
ncbi:hypothetical protein B0T25DRAFT_3972 [Lasiosphaeria hispida]|uniref:Uncharacterized protein n=1 Tax=Lasiosphaeria hispida TaxID=260671 RepID=A0AAJ0MJ19_9PEZI|nr:hypothetical protein B0T25DRAFT_3972 [Lasiosphaeria hispida]